MKDFRSLLVWQKSHQFTLKIYSVTKLFPKEELFGLTSQLNRASSSIPINIAEGYGRGSDADFGKFFANEFRLSKRNRILNPSKSRNRLYFKRDR